ncbi:leucine-rich repeat domain-containing protein [Brevundimonas sp.]|uniref:leucine-rich repeat domain-containing protein n=1 Tax=Brevundimonas sp. TaxID=1871086 RepID=UPI003D0E7DCE
MKREVPAPEEQRIALVEAKRRIKIAAQAGANEIGFQDLVDLSEIPASIRTMKELTSVSFEDTCVSDLTPLAELENLNSIDVDNTFVIDLTPIAGLKSLYSLYFSDTLVSDISPLSDLKNLMNIHMRSTSVSDLAPLSDLPRLRAVYADGTRITDLSPLSKSKTLQSLDISNTAILDLSPLRSIITLNDLNISRTNIWDLSPLTSLKSLFNPFSARGLAFSSCKKLPDDIRALSSRRNPGRSIEVGRILNVESFDEPDIDEEAIENTILVQRPAPYSFVWTEEKLEALPHHQDPFDENLAQDILDLVVEKINLAIASLSGNQFDSRLAGAFSATLEELNRSASDVRDGILLMRMRTIQAVSSAYFSTDADYPEDIRALVMDATISLEDLLAIYPGARTIDANRQALNFQAEGTQLRSYVENANRIIEIAEASEVVDDSAVEALRDGSNEIALLSNIIDTTSSEATRASAIERRATLASLQLLGLRNFVVAPLRRVVDELGPVALDSWKQAKIAVPLGVGDGVRSVVSTSIKAGVALLATMLAGPVAGIAVLAASFVPLAKATAKVAEATDEASD